MALLVLIAATLQTGLKARLQVQRSNPMGRIKAPIVKPKALKGRIKRLPMLTKATRMGLKVRLQAQRSNPMGRIKSPTANLKVLIVKPKALKGRIKAPTAHLKALIVKPKALKGRIKHLPMLTKATRMGLKVRLQAQRSNPMGRIKAPTAKPRILIVKPKALKGRIKALIVKPKVVAIQTEVLAKTLMDLKVEVVNQAAKQMQEKAEFTNVFQVSTPLNSTYLDLKGSILGPIPISYSSIDK